MNNLNLFVKSVQFQNFMSEIDELGFDGKDEINARPEDETHYLKLKPCDGIDGITLELSIDLASGKEGQGESVLAWGIIDVSGAPGLFIDEGMEYMYVTLHQNVEKMVQQVYAGIDSIAYEDGHKTRYRDKFSAKKIYLFCEKLIELKKIEEEFNSKL